MVIKELDPRFNFRRDGSMTAPDEHTIFLVSDKDGQYETLFLSSYIRTREDAELLEERATYILSMAKRIEELGEENQQLRKENEKLSKRLAKRTPRFAN